MSYNWKLALRKAFIQAMVALFIQFASMEKWPTIEQLWIPLVLAGLAFFTVLEKEENQGVSNKILKLKNGENQGASNNSLNLKKVKRVIAESLMG